MSQLLDFLFWHRDYHQAEFSWMCAMCKVTQAAQIINTCNIVSYHLCLTIVSTECISMQDQTVLVTLMCGVRVAELPVVIDYCCRARV